MPYSTTDTSPPTYEKSENVFCASTESGSLLHNFITGKYIELTSFQNKVWLLLDGVHSVADIALTFEQAAVAGNLVDIEKTVALLRDNQFVVPRLTDDTGR